MRRVIRRRASGAIRELAGAVPADRPSQGRYSGGFGTPPWGHYGPCARSSLTTANRKVRGAQARPEVEADAPASAEKPQWSAGRRASPDRKGEAARLIERAGAGITCAPSVPGITSAFLEFSALPAAEIERRAAAGRRFYETQLSLSSAVDQIEQALLEVAEAR